MRYLLDTNTVSDYFRRRGGVAAALHAHPPHELGVSAITVHEIHFGLLRQPTAASALASRVRTFLSVVATVPFEPIDALSSADVRARLERSGKGIGVLDCLIAGVALARGFTLVTSNTSEFGRVAGLSIENWR